MPKLSPSRSLHGNLLSISAAAILAATAAAADGPVAPTPPDLLAQIAASQEQAERRVRRGFDRVDQGFQRVENGFDRVEREFERAIRRDLSIAALAALPAQDRGWTYSVGLSLDARRGLPGGALAIGYANERAAIRISISGPEPVIAIGLTLRR